MGTDASRYVLTGWRRSRTQRKPVRRTLLGRSGPQRLAVQRQHRTWLGSSCDGSGGAESSILHVFASVGAVAVVNGAEVVMSAVEKIQIAEEGVLGLQGQLDVVESVLGSAETVIVAGEKTGRGLRRFVKLLIVLGLVAVVVIILKNLMAGRSDGIDEPEFVTAVVETATETDVADEVDDEAAAEDDEDSES